MVCSFWVDRQVHFSGASNPPPQGSSFSKDVPYFAYLLFLGGSLGIHPPPPTLPGWLSVVPLKLQKTPGWRVPIVPWHWATQPGPTMCCSWRRWTPPTRRPRCGHFVEARGGVLPRVFLAGPSLLSSCPVVDKPFPHTAIHTNRCWLHRFFRHFITLKVNCSRRYESSNANLWFSLFHSIF